MGLTGWDGVRECATRTEQSFTPASGRPVGPSDPTTAVGDELVQPGAGAGVLVQRCRPGMEACAWGGEGPDARLRSREAERVWIYVVRYASGTGHSAVDERGRGRERGGGGVPGPGPGRERASAALQVELQATRAVLGPEQQ